MLQYPAMNEPREIRQALAEASFLKQPALVFKLAWLRFYRDGCVHRAAAISYSTLLSLVPLAAVVLFFITYFGQYFGQLDEVQQTVQDRVIDFVFPFSTDSVPAATGPPAVGNLRLAEGAMPATAEVRQNTEDRLGAIINQKLSEFVANARALGVVGGVFFLVFAMLLVVAVEEAFNAVWRGARRSWYARVLNYWALLSLGPVFLVASLVLTSGLLAHAPASVQLVLPTAASFIGFWILFEIMPASRVSPLAAVGGALVTSVLWELAKHAFAWYTTHYTGLQNVYGSLFVVPILLMWVYYTWLVILFGVEVSYVLHHARSRLEPAGSQAVGVDRETLEEMRRMRDRIEEILTRLNRSSTSDNREETQSPESNLSPPINQ